MSEEVRNNLENGQFEVSKDGQTASLEYQLRNGKIILVHTEVPPALEGQGIGGRLAKAGLDYARANNLKVVPQCDFVQSYLKRHPEYNDLIQS